MYSQNAEKDKKQNRERLGGRISLRENKKQEENRRLQGKRKIPSP